MKDILVKEVMSCDVSPVAMFSSGLCTDIDGSIDLFGDLHGPCVDILCGPSGSSVSLLPLDSSSIVLFI